MVNFIKEHKAISAVILANILAVIGVIIAIIYHHQQTASIDIQVTPIDATISINGKNYENLTSHNMLPGDYHVVISMDGMQEKELDFTLEKDGFYKLQAYLLDENGGFDYYLNHPGDELILSEIADDKKSKEFVKKYEKATSILNELPIEYDSYTPDFAFYTQFKIAYSDKEDCPKVACLDVIDSTGNSEEAAIQLIRDKGFNPDDYEITYIYKPLESIRITENE